MKVKKIASNRAKYSFTVTPHEFEHALEHAYESIKKDVELKGFRKGHVPQNVYESKFGVESLYEDALNHVLYHKFNEAHQLNEFQIVGQPNVDVDLQKVTREKEFSMSFEVAVKPDVELGQYKEIEAEYPKTTVTAKEVTEKIQADLDRNSNLVPKAGKLELGDTAIFDFEGLLDGTPFEGGKAENYELEIGSNQFIPGFEEQMIGLAAGEEKDLDVTFPKDYQAKDLAGKAVVFKVKLHEIKTKEKAELTDEWVASLNKDGVTTVEELKKAVRKELKELKEQDAEAQFSNTIIETVIETAKMDVPAEMIEQETNQFKEQVAQQAKQYGIEYEMFLSLNGMNPEQFEERAKIDATKRVRFMLTMEAIAKAEKLAVDEKELNEQFEVLAKQYQMPAEEIRKYLPASVLTNDLLINKAFKFVIDHAKKA
ncbi:MAG: trigger factor [Acholeplasmataceae bacterium]